MRRWGDDPVPPGEDPARGRGPGRRLRGRRGGGLRAQPARCREHGRRGGDGAGRGADAVRGRGRHRPSPPEHGR